ncbi:HlyD family type I secretion periplasmic adaptor subunit [Blastochloris tepida]|uniref:Membrane fusion protein (MFP) family protein n=2 Tax=Blastochloris tepida TaxID=2233851 RepID=A0A348G040_9HYPH|nr:HlyD family type I secretion periplasmic adaptor subunit [Blastochloris tepida]
MDKMSDTDTGDLRATIRRLNVVGFIGIALMVGGIGSWAATSELSGAVVGPGTIVVESNVKKVQHPSGGVVGEILVKDGSQVETGQLLMRLDETVTRATLGVVRSQLDEFTVRQARLNAENEDRQEIAFPASLLARSGEPAVTLALESERRLMESRRESREGQRAQLRERIGQTREEIAGLTGQREAKDRELALIREELAGVGELYKKNLVSIQRLMQLRREETRVSGERNQLVTDSARAKAKISEIELQILQLDQDFRTQVLRELREVQGKIAELTERVAAAEDMLKRVEIRAPQRGVVYQMSVHTVGGVVSPGETLMLIVPRADELVVEARIAPSDIDQVSIASATLVRILAGNQRTTPQLQGEVTWVAADLTKDQQTGQSHYLVRVTLPASEVAKLGELKLVPGMPAEVFVQTGERTALQYLMKPLHEQIARTFIER